jgi:SAM-dependent methyltransferase
MNAHQFEPLQAKDVALYARRRVLNGGSGPHTPHGLHSIFKNEGWREVRLDINLAAQPDVVASITNMRAFFAPGSFDAVWSSHSLEHLHGHEVPMALSEFRRILKPEGFALMRCPDLEAVVSLLLDHGTDHVAYTSPIGPITPLDMLFGHGASIAAGNRHMAHKTGFTAARLGHLLLEADFATVFTRSVRYDLWALALMKHADQSAIESQFRVAGFAGFDAVH